MTDSPNIPSAWLSDEDAWEVEGFDFVDKKELLNIPFRIVGVSFRTGKNGVQMVFCEAEKVDGSTVQFSDASTGIKAQVSDLWLSRIGTDPEYTTEERWHPLSIIVRHGLRVSKYLREGTREWAETYYLRASGRRMARVGTTLQEPAVPAERVLPSGRTLKK